MKIVTWNLGYWQFARYHAEAWAYLREEFRPDLALLQEVSIPAFASDEKVIFKSIRKPWGTAVYARNGNLLEELPVHVHPTRIAAATLKVPHSHQHIVVASIHAPVINGRVFPHLDVMFDELETIFSGRTAIFGGDLNSARLAETVWPGHGHGPFFERLSRRPIVDCHRRFSPQEIQTFFRANSVHPFQDDHLFVTQDLGARLTSCEVLLNDTTRRVSDHIPMVVTLDL